MSLEVNEKVCKRCSKNLNDGGLHSTLYCSRDCQKEDWKCSKNSKNENNEMEIDEPSYTVITRPQEIMLVRKVKPRGILLNSDMVNQQQIFDTYLNTSLEVKLCSHIQSSNLCFTSSASNEYFASFFVMQDSPTVKITVYQFKIDQVCIYWQGDFPLSADDKYVAVVDTDGFGKLELEGSLMNDGETLFLHISSDYSHCLHLLIKDKGSTVTWVHPERKERQFKCRDYQFSEDERYLFIIGTAEVNTARTVESYPVEAYSTTSWELIKKWSVECDYKRTVTNVKLLGPLYFDKSIHVAIKSDHSEHSLIQDLQNDVTVTLPIHDFNYNSSRRVWISKGGNNLVALPIKKGSLCYWDLANPTYHPLQECTLLGVENEREVITSKHEYLCRFSPDGEVITIISANDRVINIQIMLTWNLHIVEHISIDYSSFNEYQAWSVGMSETSGLLIFGAIFPPYPSAGAIRVVVSSIPGIYDHVSKAEKYFDAISNGIHTVDCELFSSWEVMTAYNKFSITPTSKPPESTPVDDIARDGVYELIFLSNNCYDPGMLLELDAAEKVIHLLTFSYPWNEACKVHVFAVKCNHTLTIIAVRFVKRHRMPGDFTEMCIRILYTDHNIFGSGLTLEITKCEDYYSLTIEHKSELRTYSGILHATKTSVVITDFNIKCDAKYDIFAISDSRSITLPNDWFVSPNNIITSSSTFCGYIPNFGQDGCNGLLRFGSRKRSAYSASKLEMWLNYTHRDRTSDNILDEQFINIVSNNYDSMFEDVNYDDKDWLFPCVFAGAMNVDVISDSHLLTDEFLKQYHQSKELIMKNMMTITYCISAACRVQPAGVRSLLNHIALWTMDIEDRKVNVRSNDESKKNENFIKRQFEIIRGSDKFIEIANFKRKILKNISKNETLMGIVNFIRWRLNPSLLYDMFSLMKYQRSNQTTYSTVTKYTLPLAGFCSYKNKVFQLPKWNYKLDSRHNSLHQMAMLSFGQVTTLISNQTKPYHSFAESPFSCLIDEILDIKNEDLMLDFFEIIWLKKLLKWKLDTFAKRKYLERLLIPMLINLLMHLLSGILITQGNQDGAKVTASLQLIVIIYLGLYESKLLVTRSKYWKSFFNYIDLITILLSFTMVIRVLSNQPSSGVFNAYSTVIVWVDMILQFRFYKPIGVLLIVLKDMVKEIFWFLALLTTLLVGFAFMPFFLLRNEVSNFVIKTNSFEDFGSALVETIKFLGNDFDSLKPWDDRVSIQLFRILFIILIFLLFLNMLIVLLNLHVKSITKKVRIII
jgi:hypothetical protein